MAPSIPVLPLLDVHREVLEFRIRGTWQRFHVADADALAAALANAVASPRWDPDARALVVRIPKAGCATGQARIFSLSEFSRTLPNVTLVG
ncbi:hypothetical protein DQ353_10665 [Arthrobacter sp. AQ5-05]|uniref:hypothetical protein n=1 Tax=Arthrobacter sp. AQ5-05 TaxID=2184581 RepID=UPI000DCBE2BE|nr:hypothetical protein [Arthrobacter sp. AQ5-05]RAX49257.1 hypothetical protein DQ353_10665 [Arthrobacter sp. AQ5-05]